MPGKDFEQQVRDTMGSWRIEPSAGTWGRLEEGLARKKKRRRAFYFFLLAGLLAGGALLLTEKALHEPDHAAHPIASSMQRPEPVHSPGANAGREAGPQQTEAGKTTNPAANSSPAVNSTSFNSGPESTNPASAIDRAGNSTTAVRQTSGNPSTASRLYGRSNATRAFAGDADPRKQRLPADRAKDEQADGDRPLSIAENPGPSSGHRAYASPFSIADTIATRPMAIGGTPAPSTSAGSGQADKYTRKKHWSFGLTAGAGRAAFTEGIGLSQAKSADLNAGPSTGSGVPPQGPAYDYRQDPSAGWEAGGWTRVSVSRKWSFTAGVSYMQLSTRTPVGQSLGDSSRSYYNGYTRQVSTNSFSAGSQSEYRNRYHLLQLPLTAEWQLTPGRRLPVIWSMGLSPGYLLSSNALVRDSAQALYSHPDNQRGFQLGMRTGLRFRLMPSSAHPLDIGPVLQYQLNEVFADGIRDNGHLYYLGVEARLPLFFLSRVQR